ncbi:Hsp70 family protein [Kitasatospora sp. NPDC089913]|uniref:Hsp70 family protein n=1 Tax=Kitasatospora sp. NPDC089913 TaxID=3364080 RepID=UPI003822F04E
MTREPVLAVDFGTSTSAAALVADGRVRLIKEPSGDSWAWPSTVSWDGARLLVGTPAEHRRAVHPASFRSEFKRDLGERAPLLLGDASYRAEELVAALLAAVRGEAERLHGQAVTRAVLTYPASYGPGDPRRRLLVGAGEAAGLTVVDLLAEPVAAALAPIAGPALQPGDLVLVHDFGGGTFDAALVRMPPPDASAEAVEVLGHTALDDCGGHDIDVLVAEELVRLGGDRLTAWLRPGGAPKESDGATDRLRREVELADLAHRFKHRLSVEAEVDDYLRSAGLPTALGRDRLAELAAPLVARTVTRCRELLERCGQAPDRLAAVLLVGGSTRMPAVRDALAEAFPGLLRHVEDPELAVAQGAAAWAGLATRRYSAAERPTSSGVPFGWQLPGDSGRLLRWYVAPGEEFAADAVLALVRLADGGLWELRADGRPGTVARLHVAEGAPVSSGDWLLTTGRAGGRRTARSGKYGGANVRPRWAEAAPLRARVRALPEPRPVGPVLPVPGDVPRLLTVHGEQLVCSELLPAETVRQWERPGIGWATATAPGAGAPLAAAIHKSGRQVDVLDLTTGALECSVPLPTNAAAVAFSADGALLAVTDIQRRLRLVRTVDGEVTAEIDLSRFSPTGGQAFSPDLEFTAVPVGQTVVLCHTSGRRAESVPQLTLSDLRLVRPLPVSAGFASGASDLTAVDVWSLGGYTARLRDPALAKAFVLAVGPDERLLAAADQAGCVSVWELPQPDPEQPHRLLEVSGPLHRMTLPTPPRNLVFGTDSSTLFAATDRELHSWDLEKE